jgi:hypothetical protein
MRETIDDEVRAINVETQIVMQGGQYIAVDPKTLEKQADGTYVGKGKWKTAGLFWDSTIEQVSVMYDSDGKFIDYDSLTEED